MSVSIPVIVPVGFFLLLLFRYICLRVQYRLALNRANALSGCRSPPTIASVDPIFGLDTALQSLRWLKHHRRMRGIYDQIQTYGPTFQSWPFGRRVISTVDSRNIQAVYSTQHDSFGVAPIRDRAQSPMTGHGIITSDGMAWEHARSMLVPTFNRTHIADQESFDVHVDNFLKLLPEDGSIVDLQHLFDRLILDSSSEFIFGESFQSLLPDCPYDAKQFLECFDYAQRGVGARVQLGKMDFLLRDRRFWYSCRVIKDFTQKIVDKALARQERGELEKKEKESYVLVYKLAKGTGNREPLRDHLLNVFFAGRDTPAVALTSVFFCLARHPDAWARLRDEVRGLQPEDLSFEKLKSLRYLQNVIKEALRLYPPVANNSRACLKRVILPVGRGSDGHSPICVLPGDVISINFFTLHRNPDVYKDPEAFLPERWESVRPHWDYLPFGGGARQCPGQQLALFWVGYTLARMALQFKRIENRDPVMEYVESLKLNMESLNGAKVSLVVA